MHSPAFEKESLSLCQRVRRMLGWPPLPRVRAKALLGAGFAKWVAQNLVFKDLRYQNPDNKRLRLAGSISLNGPSLDDDRANSMAGARSDVTKGVPETVENL